MNSWLKTRKISTKKQWIQDTNNASTSQHKTMGEQLFPVQTLCWLNEIKVTIVVKMQSLE